MFYVRDNIFGTAPVGLVSTLLYWYGVFADHFICGWAVRMHNDGYRMRQCKVMQF